MANEITKVTDQNGVDHALVDVKGRAATVDLLKDTTGWTGKNLIKCDIDSLKADNTTGTWSGNVYTLMGVTYTPTFTEDGYLKTVIVNGENSSSSNNSDFQINRRYYNSDNLGKVTILNGCPNTIGNKGRIGFRVGNKTSGTFITVYEDKGSGVNIPVLGSNEDGGINITIFLQQSVSNLEFYPMLRDASILDQTFEPYHKSVEDWYWSENAKLGAHQLIPLTLVDLKAMNTTGTWTNNVYEINSVTLTCEEKDGYVTKITANGTPTGGNIWFLMNIWHSGLLDKGSYELLGCPTGGSSSSYQILFREDPQVTGGVFVATYGNPVPFTISDSSKRYVIFIGLQLGAPLSNKVFTPLIRYAGDTNSECTPYAITNAKLSSLVTRKVLTPSFDLNNIFKYGDYYWENVTPVNAPESITYGSMRVYPCGDIIYQEVIRGAGDRATIYLRRYQNSWSSWYKFTGTVVS